MADKRWLNIVVDGNVALESYWHDIVSNYLEKIVRNFEGSTEEEEAYLGLVMYNADTTGLDEGSDMRFINWTKDVNEYLEKISHLSFKGSDEHQYTMAEALAEALVMYPKPSDMMNIIEYKNAERHCILVAKGEPIAKTLMLCLPMLNKDKQLVNQRLKPCPANFLDVAQRFPQIGVSLSVITPTSLPIFGRIFNLGNDLGLATAPISSYSNGKFTVLLSKNFQRAHYALRGKGLASTSPAATTLPTSNLQDEANVTALAPSTNSQMNEYDDMIAELSGGDLLFIPSKRTRIFTTLEEELNLKAFFESFDDNTNNSVGQVVSTTTEMIPLVETEFQNEMRNNTSYTSSAQEGPSAGLHEDILYNRSLINPMAPAPENCSISSAFLVSSQQQQQPSSVLLPQALESQHGMMSNSTTQLLDGHGLSSYNNLPFPRGPMLQGGYQYQRNNMSFFYAPFSTPGILGGPTSHEKQILSSPSLDDFRYYNVLTWEGYLVGQVFSIELGVTKAKAYKKPTTPLKLTSNWKDGLNITYLMPPDAVDYTKNVTDPLDYVFFQMLHFTHVDLYKHLKSKNMCAKLDLPHQIIILSPTEREHLFIGAVFPGYTVFTEQNL